MGALYTHDINITFYSNIVQPHSLTTLLAYARSSTTNAVSITHCYNNNTPNIVLCRACDGRGGRAVMHANVGGNNIGTRRL